MAKLILEVIDKQGRVAERHLIEEASVRVGRGYSNGVVLSDPFISPEHISISAEKDLWRVEDLASENGMFRRGESTPQGALMIASGEEICIGRTTLRILSPEHPVPPASSMLVASVKEGGWSVYSLASTIFIALAMVFAGQYFDNAEKVAFQKLLAQTLLVMPPALLWAGGWAFLGKVSKQKHSFAAQLRITMICVIALLIMSTLLEYIEYNVKNPTTVTSLQILCVGLMAGYALSRHLLLATSMDLRKVRNVSIGMVFGLIGGLGFIYYAITSDFDPNPRYSLTLKPPLAQVRSTASIDDFFSENRALFKKLR